MGQHCPLFVKVQSWVPQQGLSRLAGYLANSKLKCLKNHLIRSFLNRYPVKMEDALESDPYAYASFNAFFTRRLKPLARPIAREDDHFVSPADGFLQHFGPLDPNRPLEAKGHPFELEALLGTASHEKGAWKNGLSFTVYLSPSDYHRVHMPCSGTLRQMHYIPGRLFSVNDLTAQHIPNLFSRNERVVLIFDTPFGKMALVLVGAMLVGHIQTVWAGSVSSHDHQPKTWTYSHQPSQRIFFRKGEEIAHFEMGSTVIGVMAQPTLDFHTGLYCTQPIQMGQTLARAKQNS